MKREFHQRSSCTVSLLVLTSVFATRLSARCTTRSAMPAIAALCVMTTVDVPSSWFTRAMASSTTAPVVMSKAPVGSSHRVRRDVWR